MEKISTQRKYIRMQPNNTRMATRYTSAVQSLVMVQRNTRDKRRFVPTVPV